MPKSRSRSTVMIRAMSCRTLRDLARVLELADGVLEAELVELATRRRLQPTAQLVHLEHSQLVDLHLAASRRGRFRR